MKTGMTHVQYSSLFCRAVIPLEELPSMLKAFTTVKALVE